MIFTLLMKVRMRTKYFFITIHSLLLCPELAVQKHHITIYPFPTKCKQIIIAMCMALCLLLVLDIVKQTSFLFFTLFSSRNNKNKSKEKESMKKNKNNYILETDNYYYI